MAASPTRAETDRVAQLANAIPDHLVLERLEKRYGDTTVVAARSYSPYSGQTSAECAI